MNEDTLMEFNALSCDAEKWEWVKNHQSCGIVVKLDNDDTYGILQDEEDEDDCSIFQFDHYIGKSYGVRKLLEAYGVKAELV